MTQSWIIALLSTTSVTITLFDSCCLYMIWKNKRARRPSTIAVWNLLFCHLLQGIIVVPSYILKRSNFNDAQVRSAVCDTFRFSYMVTNYLSCLSLLLITLDRMFAIKRPLLYRSTMTNRKIASAVIGCWFYVVILCSVPFIPSSGKASKCKYNPQREWTTIMLTCHTMLPFFIILYSYFLIFSSARNSRILRTSVFAMSETGQSHRETRESEMRIAKISAVVASAYVICWGPSFVYYFLLSTCAECFRASYFDSTAELVITFVMKYMTFLNGIIAPVIYCYRYNSFRDIFPFLRTNQVAPS